MMNLVLCANTSKACDTSELILGSNSKPNPGRMFEAAGDLAVQGRLHSPRLAPGREVAATKIDVRPAELKPAREKSEGCACALVASRVRGKAKFSD
jgi:hypothetical protein